MTHAALRFMVLACVAVGLSARSAHATTISLGTAIPIASNTFAVPIVITGGSHVVEWQVDVTYDAANVLVNTGCDPFTDVYCSLITGPVTEGPYFASGAPFNLLNPGFVVLDPMTLAQTGSLLAVNGIFGGVLPGPSGDGVLAYIEFSRVGTGAPSIGIQNPSVTELTPVPEPSTLLLLGPTVLAMFRRTRRIPQEDR